MSGVVVGPDGVARCAWGDSAPDYRPYHDTEWGFPVSDDVRLFEKLSLEGFQSGLSWLTILRKREAFRRAFGGFDFTRVARFGERDVARLLSDAGIVRHRGKIEAVINNAKRAVELVEAEGSLAGFVWRFEPEAPPARTALDALSRTDRRVAGVLQGAQAARVEVRRTDDRVRVHAGDGARQRPSRRLRHASRRRAGTQRVHASDVRWRWLIAPAAPALAALAALALVGCGFDVQSPDDFLLTRTGQGKTLTLLVNDSGTIRCNGSKPRPISDALLISTNSGAHMKIFQPMARARRRPDCLAEGRSTFLHP